MPLCHQRQEFISCQVLTDPWGQQGSGLHNRNYWDINHDKDATNRHLCLAALHPEDNVTFWVKTLNNTKSLCITKFQPQPVNLNRFCFSETDDLL